MTRIFSKVAGIVLATTTLAQAQADRYDALANSAMI
jgi:hypothetical protein